ncbi:hypothetical protein C5S53_12865 [Methanophagales archaeon]|nr:hypothetical protein C5S53_12865 [Methanophagales archaeon]
MNLTYSVREAKRSKLFASRKYMLMRGEEDVHEKRTAFLSFATARHVN